MSPVPTAVLTDATRGIVRHALFSPEQGVVVVQGHDGIEELGAEFPAAASMAQLFDSPHAPDVLVCFEAEHPFHGNPGEHGALGVEQAVAPFVVAGPGTRAAGRIDRPLAMVDVAPTLTALLDCSLSRTDGVVAEDLLDPDDRPDHVLVFLLDGCNARALQAAIDDGAVPTIAGLAERGTATTVVASLPTATLANHTTALTGLHPGHSGVLHNTWHDRQRGVSPDLLDMAQMIESRMHINADAETVFEALRRSRPTAWSGCTYEYADRGADWSTYAELTARRRVARPTAPFVTSEPWIQDDGYLFMARADEWSTEQARLMWDEPAGPLPTFCWVTLNLTDKAGHTGGPESALFRASLVETDARLGAVLAAVERAGALARTAVVVLADHGMAQTVPAEPLRLEPLLDEAWLVIDNMLLYRR